jgi:hypothetical protein
MKLLEQKRPWSDGLKKVVQLYPASIGSANWPEIKRLAASGEVEKAKELASRGEKFKQIKAHNVTARATRIQQMEFFSRIAAAERGLRAMLDLYVEKISDAVLAKGSDLKNLRRMSEIIDEETKYLRASMRIWINAAIRDSAKLGFRHIGDALLPIFKANRESVEREFIAERAIFEAKLSFGLNVTFAKRAKPTVSAAVAAANVAKIIRARTAKSLVGLRPKDTVWALTDRSRQDLKRIVANGMGNGEHPTAIARKIKKYVSPAIMKANKLGIEVGPGVYRSPYRNAMRLARTEMNRTYTQGVVAFSKEKPWIKGYRVALSSAHTEEDDCDGIAGGGVYTADQVEDMLPVHPHCMCRPVPQIDEKYLGEDTD